MKQKICLLAMASIASLSAFSYSGQVCGSFEVVGEALYWKPSSTGFDYVYGTTLIDVGVEFARLIDVRTLKSSYDWGFRAAGRYEAESGCSSWELAGRYVNFCDSARIRGPNNLNETFGQMVFGNGVSATLETDYWTLDLLWNQHLHRDCCMRLWVFGGVRYTSMDTRFSDRSSGGPDATTMGGTGRTKADFRGIGPEVGAGAEHCMWDCFTIFGTFDAAALASRRTYRQDTTNIGFPGVTSRLRYSRVWGAVPALDLRLGVAYTYRCGCWFIRGQVGYELNYYWNVNKVRVPFTAQAPAMPGTSFQRVDRDLGFGGGFFGLAVGF